MRQPLVGPGGGHAIRQTGGAYMPQFSAGPHAAIGQISTYGQQPMGQQQLMGQPTSHPSVAACMQPQTNPTLQPKGAWSPLSPHDITTITGVHSSQLQPQPHLSSSSSSSSAATAAATAFLVAGGVGESDTLQLHAQSAATPPEIVAEMQAAGRGYSNSHSSESNLLGHFLQPLGNPPAQQQTTPGGTSLGYQPGYQQGQKDIGQGISTVRRGEAAMGGDVAYPDSCCCLRDRWSGNRLQYGACSKLE